MRCNNCGQEIVLSEKKFSKLICKPIEQFGVSFKDIKIPDGWRIPTLQEGVDLVNNIDFVKWSKFDDGNYDFYVQQPFKKNIGKYSAWLGCSSGDLFLVYSSSDLSLNYAVRGVLLIKKVKK